LCFGLNGDFSEKKGQIAHIDQKPANQRDDNLVFPCLDHHDAFDSCTSQSKGLTREEVEFYKDKLFEAVQTKLPGRVSKDISVSAELEAVTTFFRSLRRLDLFAGSMLSGYEIQQAHAADLLGIDPFVHDHLTWSGYRLSSGNEGVVDGHLVKFSKDQPLMLEPNAFAAVSTEEVLALPPWLVGKLAPHQASTLRFGLFTDSPSTVDPGFRGRLFVTAHNRSRHSIIITSQMPLITLELFFLNSPPHGWSPWG
jgi:deoxycytidine triphosphate deaminase